MELFQVRTQLERTSSAKLDEMLSFQKAASDKTGLGYDFSSPNIASSSTIVFVSPVDNVNSKNDEAKTQIASENPRKKESVVLELAHGYVSKFLLVGSDRMLAV